MSDSLLIANAGSSSIKFATYAALAGSDPQCTHRGELESIGGAAKLSLSSVAGAQLLAREFETSQVPNHSAAIEVISKLLREQFPDARWIAIGHRVVHGGGKFSASVLLNPETVRALEEITPLDPLHQPHSLSVIKRFAELFPGVPQVASFDTAFHASQPLVATQVALPRKFAEEGVRRYGFHGLSYEYIASALSRVAPKIAAGRVIVAHLGSGASMCAIQNGKSIATTMGFSVLDGLVMGTRCGLLDPGIILYLMERHAMGVRELEDLLYSKSGLLGVSGLSNDMRVLTSSADPRAKEAVDLFVYRIIREFGSLTAALGGLDGIVFTAGIGERSAIIRAQITRSLGWLGVIFDEAANSANREVISKGGSKVEVLVIPTDEAAVMARHTMAVCRPSAV